MSTTQELQRRLNDLQFLAADFEQRLVQRQQALDLTRSLIAQERETIPRIERALARAREAGDTARLAQIQTDLDNALASVTELSAQASREQAALELTQNSLRDAQQDIAAVETEIKAVTDQGPGTTSAGETVSEAQTANDDGASTQAPDAEQEVLAPEGRIETADTYAVTNADTGDAEPTTGTAAPTRAADQIQTVPPPTSATPIQPGSPSNQVSGVASGNASQVPNSEDAPGTPSIGRGAAADNDDNTNPTVSRINDIFGGAQSRIQPSGNVLDQYSNYTYNISIYLAAPDAYQQFRQTGSMDLNGANLLIQSGGAQIGQRNQEFPLDFYIDDLQITSLISGKGTGGAHNAVELSFQVIEPNGVTFLDRLSKAVRAYVKNANQTQQTNNYSAQIYIMVIRFWGYDAEGNLVRVSSALESGGAAPEPGLIAAKYIPFRFTQIKFKLAGRLAQYDCKAVTPRDYVAPSQTRGIIPYNIELTSVTLQELLGVNLAFGTTNTVRSSQGRQNDNQPPTPANQQNFQGQVDVPNSSAGSQFEAQFGGDPTASDTSAAVSPVIIPSQSSAPAKASAAPRPTLVRGLTAALNEFQAELVRNGTYQYADVYEIIINENVLREAVIQPPEAGAGLRSVPMTAAQTAGAKKLGIKQQVNRDVKNVSAVAGMSIVQFLDQVVRNSSYIFDQQTKIYKKDSSGRWTTQPRATGGRTFAWYRIGMDAVPLRDRYDEKRGDYAYRISYTITPYQVNDSKSGWFPQSRFYGTHKKYEYWFTGLNTQILNYEQDYDYLYYITVNSGQATPRAVSDYREYQQFAFQARAPEASQGAAGPLFDPPALAASTLYSPGDTSRIKMSIMGDPAWLQQGEITTGIKGYSESLYAPFLSDGTINYDSREILFEVTFNTAGDYDLETGLMDVTRRAG
jgi:hypothetical protein